MYQTFFAYLQLLTLSRLGLGFFSSVDKFEMCMKELKTRYFRVDFEEY